MNPTTSQLWKLVIFSAITDIITTYVGINFLSLKETNPFVFTTSGIGFLSLMVLLKSGAILLSYNISIIFDYRRIVPLTLSFVWLFVSIWNMVLILFSVI